MPTGSGDTNGTAVRGRVRVNWREVVLFGLLAYGLAWAWWGFLFFPYLGTLLTQSTTPSDLVARAGAAVVLGMFAPMIAALVMRLFVSKDGVKGSLGLRRSWKYYLAALIAPPVFATAVVLIVQAPGRWHPTVEGGLYQIDEPAKWIRATAPYLLRLGSIMKYTMPLVGPFLGVAVPTNYGTHFKNDIALMNELAEARS